MEFYSAKRKNEVQSYALPLSYYNTKDHILCDFIYMKGQEWENP